MDVLKGKCLRNVSCCFCVCFSLYENSTCRHGIDKVFEVLEKNEVPLVIFSTGVGGESIVGKVDT